MLFCTPLHSMEKSDSVENLKIELERVQKEHDELATALEKKQSEVVALQRELNLKVTLKIRAEITAEKKTTPAESTLTERERTVAAIRANLEKEISARRSI